MLPGRWLPTLLTVAVSARVLWLASHALFGPDQVTRLAENVEYRVVGVPDATRLRIHPASLPGDTSTVQLLGVEPAAPPGSPLRHQARAELARWLLNRTVTLQLDRRQIDDEGRLLAYVFQGEECVNERLVRAGHCRARAQPCDYPSIVRRLRQAETLARQERRGAWQHVALRE